MFNFTTYISYCAVMGYVYCACANNMSALFIYFQFLFTVLARGPGLGLATRSNNNNIMSTDNINMTELCIILCARARDGSARG